MKTAFVSLAFLALALPVTAQTPCGVNGVTVTVSPSVAAPGQPIQVTVTNNSSQVITLPSACSYGAVFANGACSGSPVFSPLCATVLTPINPGQSHTTPWNQQDNGGAQVPNGTYSFRIDYYDGAFGKSGCCAVGMIGAGGTTTYCTAKTNSCGGAPAIGFSGTPSATAGNGFDVLAKGTKATKCGLLIYGDSGPATPALPFQGGWLCVSPPVRRSVAVCDSNGTPGQCNGSLALDMNAFAAGALGGNPLPSLTMPGTQVNCQYWARDSVGQSLLSDALQYLVGP